jgi:hypothetical protein
MPWRRRSAPVSCRAPHDGLLSPLTGIVRDACSLLMPDDLRGHRAPHQATFMARHLPRPRYLRAFVCWLAERGDQLPIRLCRTLTRRDFLVYRLAGYPPELEVIVGGHEVSVTVTHQGRFWDILTCFESAAGLDGLSYRCHFCPPDSAHWPDRVALWRDHDFEPLAGWLCSALATADRLELHQLSGLRWAALGNGGAQEDTDSLTISFTLPVHADRTSAPGREHA